MTEMDKRRLKVRSWLSFSLALTLILFLALNSIAQESELTPPAEFSAYDTPDDSGDAITLVWKAASNDRPSANYQIYMSESGSGEFKKIAEFPSNTHYQREMRKPWWTRKFTDNYHYFLVQSGNGLAISDGKQFFFKLTVTEGERTVESNIVNAFARPNLFNFSLLNNFILMVIFSGVLLYSIGHAKKNPNLFLRRIPGLDAVEEAIGRATEMGRPILYLTGSDGMDSLSTIAATVILGEVAKRVATYDTEIKVPHRDPVVMAVCQEIVKEAYISAGRPDAYKDDSNFFITTDQFSYTASVDGIMLREKPAANFYMGFYYAEALLLAETGAQAGAIQIAGTDADHQLPFFVTACDYTLIGEELYAASAYLSREPVLLGTLRGQDIGKGFLLGVILLGTLLATFGAVTGMNSVSLLLDLFKDFK